MTRHYTPLGTYGHEDVQSYVKRGLHRISVTVGLIGSAVLHIPSVFKKYSEPFPRTQKTFPYKKV